MSVPSSIDISGRWVGFYTQHDHPRPIRLQLDQTGDRLEGVMADDCTSIRTPLSDLAIQEGMPPGADERIVATLRASCPELPEDPVIAEVQLSPTSRLEGEIQAQAVRFRKTYQGPHFAGYRIGEYRLGVMGLDQEVDFSGLLSADGKSIEGYWNFTTPPHPFWHSDRGRFFIERDGAAEPGAGVDVRG